MKAELDVWNDRTGNTLSERELDVAIYPNLDSPKIRINFMRGEQGLNQDIFIDVSELLEELRTYGLVK